ncbi:MAG: sugar phosphate isomerase/epimerase [Bryobacteraceae bacterium]|nr:sugar phosphate isomerase/epimerase [Bryobacteraceae bacterium]
MTRRDLLTVAPAVLLAGSHASGATSGAGKARLRTAICAYSFREALKAKTMSYEDIVRLAVDLDVDGLDMTVYWFPSTQDEFLLPLRRLAYRSAVEIYSISVRTDLCKPAGPERDKQAAELRQWIDTAGKLGAGHVRIFGGTVPKTSNESEAAGWVTEMLRDSAKYAGSKGITLGIENHGGITEKADTILSILKGVDSPWLGVNLDTGNFVRDAYPQIQKLVPYAVNVQFKENLKDAQGKDVAADWPRLVGMLRQGGYRGYLAVEYEEKEDPLVAVPRLLRDLQKLTRQV